MSYAPFLLAAHFDDAFILVWAATEMLSLCPTAAVLSIKYFWIFLSILEGLSGDEGIRVAWKWDDAQKPGFMLLGHFTSSVIKQEVFVCLPGRMLGSHEHWMVHLLYWAHKEPPSVQTQELAVNTQKPELSKLLYFRLVCWDFLPMKSSARKKRPCIKWRLFQCSFQYMEIGLWCPSTKPKEKV